MVIAFNAALLVKSRPKVISPPSTPKALSRIAPRSVVIAEPSAMKIMSPLFPFKESALAVRRMFPKLLALREPVAPKEIESALLIDIPLANEDRTEPLIWISELAPVADTEREPTELAPTNTELPSSTTETLPVELNVKLPNCMVSFAAKPKVMVGAEKLALPSTTRDAFAAFEISPPAPEACVIRSPFTVKEVPKETDDAAAMFALSFRIAVVSMTAVLTSCTAKPFIPPMPPAVEKSPRQRKEPIPAAPFTLICCKLDISPDNSPPSSVWSPSASTKKLAPVVSNAASVPNPSFAIVISRTPPPNTAVTDKTLRLSSLRKVWAISDSNALRTNRCF